VSSTSHWEITYFTHRISPCETEKPKTDVIFFRAKFYFLYFLAGKNRDFCRQRETTAVVAKTALPAAELWRRPANQGAASGSTFLDLDRICAGKNSTARCLQMQLIGARERETDRRVNGTTDVVKHLHLVCGRCVPRL